MYVTNQKDIVEWAKHCYENYPTIVNNIPKSKKKYELSMDAYADIDSNLAKSQNAIGESSNVAQLAQSYMNTYNDEKYYYAVCILSVLAQIAIDNAKRVYAISINDELKRIKQSLNIKENGYPQFWKLIQDKKLSKQNKKYFDREKINSKLKCPMNYMSELKIPSYNPPFNILSMDYFFDKIYETSTRGLRKKCKKVEELITDFSLELLNDKDYNILQRDDFEKLIEKLRTVYLSSNYMKLISLMIDRAFYITSGTKRNKDTISSNTNKNKSLLLKTLYDINPKAVIKCFSKNVKEKENG